MDVDESVKINVNTLTLQDKTKVKNGVYYASDLLKFPEELQDQVIKNSPCVEVRRSKSKLESDRPFTVASMHDPVCSTARKQSLRIIREGRKSIVSPLPPLNTSTIGTPTRRAVHIDPEEKTIKEIDTDQLHTVQDINRTYQGEKTRLWFLYGDWETVMRDEKDRIPEEAQSLIHSALGKCTLLLNKKFKFLKELIDLAEAQSNVGVKEGENPVLFEDLLGFFETVVKETFQIDKAFETIRVWRELKKWDPDYRPEDEKKLKSMSPSKRKVADSSNLPRKKLKISNTSSRFANFLKNKLSRERKTDAE
ncbi:hypothetical protein Ciccas_002379 [Cichlidogyrus casuarinus]|uniref:Uncharacterized protein n=1 Tax=Cichlidogyrus casuarinus TaxID=1844966 RepID=A0ABD2QHE8_9PLAT